MTAQEAKELAEREQAGKIAAAAQAAQDSQRQESEGAQALAHQTAVAPSAGAQAEGAAVVSAAAAPGSCGPHGAGAQVSAHDAGPPAKLSDICERLGWRMTAAEVNALGVPTEREKVTVLVRAADVPALKAALLRRVQDVL